MSVDSAMTQDMLFLAYLFEIGSSESSLKEFSTHLVTALSEGLDADIIILMVEEDGGSRPLASYGIELDPKQTLQPGCPLQLGIPLRTTIILPIVHRQCTLGSLHIYRSESQKRPSRFDNGSHESSAYIKAFLQALTSSVATSLHTRILQKQASRTLFHLHSLIENIPNAVMLFNADNKVLLSNEHARALAGRMQWDQIGDPQRNPFRLCDANGDELPRSEWPFLKAIRLSIPSVNEEYVLDFGTFQRRVLINVSPVPMSDGEPDIFVATAEDITDRAEQDQRKDDFLTVASHELRSPLTPLLGFMQMARHQAESAQTVDINVLLRAEHQAHRIRRLIEGLLDFSRIETGRLKLVCRQINLVDLLTYILEPWRSAEDTKNSFQISLPSKPLLASVDPDRIEQVITNIIDNALKYGRPDGMISIDLFRQDNHAIVTISDDGDGIDPRDLEHVFERFYQRGKNGGSFRTSMGLGLYISRQIIEQHGGSITIQSAPDSPTTVRISLPLLKQPASTPAD